LVVLLRLAYLGMTNTLAMLGLLPMSDRAKDAEILALRHQITVLERQLHGQVILRGVRVPRMNAVMERWIQTCRRELLDRTLIWNQRHLLHALHQYERHYNDHRPHRGINNARPLHPLPSPITDAGTITDLNVRRHDRLGGLLHEYEHAA
jgi:transposase InsO family protein